MTITEFQRLLDGRGSDLSRWPDVVRQDAERLLAATPAAVAALESARKLDGLLHLGMPAAADEQAVARIAAKLSAQPLPPQHKGWLSRWWPSMLLDGTFAPAWPRVAVLASVTMLGFATGLMEFDLAFGSATRPTVIATLPAGDSELDPIFEADPASSVKP